MEPVEARFRAAIELRGLMITMHRELLAREHPDEPQERIERRLRKWVLGDEPPLRQELEPGS